MEGIDPTRALETAVAGLAGVPVELERPADARHGDYATNVALRLAGQRRQPPARGRRGALRAGRAAGGSRRRRGRRPRVPEPHGRGRLAGIGPRRGARRGAEVRRRLCGDARARSGRAGLGEPDRPDHRRGRAERRIRRCGRPPARVRGQRGRARVLLQRRRHSDGPVPRVRGRDPARREASRRRIPGRLHGRSRAGARRSRAADARADRGRPGAVPDPRRHLRASERRRGGDPGGPSRRSRPSRRKAPSGRRRPRTGTTAIAW